MFGSPHMPVTRNILHARIPNGTVQCTTVVNHLVKETVFATKAHGNDAQKTRLQIDHRVVERVQHFADARHRRLGQHLIGVGLWKFAAHGVTGLDLLAPVQHFFPVGLVTHLGSFDQHVGVAGLPVGTSSDVAALFGLRLVEKFEQHRIGGVEKIF